MMMCRCPTTIVLTLMSTPYFSIAFQQRFRSTRSLLRGSLLVHQKRTPLALSMSRSYCLEVEQKFSLMDRDMEELKVALDDLQFIESGKIEMVDWYFDVVTLDLTRQDCWLRQRCVGNNSDIQWELKRGTKSQQRTSSEKSTVYEEINGEDALNVAISSLSERLIPNQPWLDSFRDDTIPDIPVPDTGLTPFAKISTQRSKWKAGPDTPMEYQTFTVDLDHTDFGYSVGEVEAMASHPDQVKVIQARIHQFVANLEPNDMAPTVGKLEYYLKMRRPEIYQVLTDLGVI